MYRNGQDIVAVVNRQRADIPKNDRPQKISLTHLDGQALQQRAVTGRDQQDKEFTDFSFKL